MQTYKGIGTAGATGALAPETAGAKVSFRPAIICQVYQLVDSQTSKNNIAGAG